MSHALTQLLTAPLEPTLQSELDDLDHNCDPRGGYVMRPSDAVKLKSVANQKCGRCHGTGVSGWKNRGNRAVVCRCVQDKAHRLSEAAKENVNERLHAAAESGRAEARAPHQDS